MAIRDVVTGRFAKGGGGAPLASGGEIDRMVVRLMGDGRSYFTMLARAQGATVRAAAAIKRVSRDMGRFGRSMSLRVTAPLLVMGTMAIRSFAKFDQAMTESTSIMKVTTAQMQEMRKVAIDLSASGVLLQAPTDLAKSYFYLASAGKNAAQSMALLPAVSRFATAGAFDMALATDLLTDAQSALGLTSKNVAQDTKNLVRVSDVLVKANTLANASVQQFATALTSKAGASLKAFNKDVEEGIAVLAALADQGVKAELAGNSLDRLIRLLSKSSMDSAKAHTRLGFKVFDTAGKMRNMGDIVANLEDILKGMSDQMKVVTLDALGFQARVQAVILPLLGTSDAIKRYEAELRKAGGTTAEVADKQMKSFSNQMKVLWNQVKVAAIELGETLAPMIRKVSVYVKSAALTWRGFSSETKSVIVVVALLAAALGPVAVGLGLALSGVSSLMRGLVVLSSVLTGTTGGIWAMRAAWVGVIGLGVAVFIASVRAELGRLNAQLAKSLEMLGRLQEAGLEQIRGMPEEQRREAIEREGLKRLQDVQNAMRAIAKEERRLAGEGIHKRPGRGLAGIIGIDPVEPFRKNLEQAEEALRKFDAFRKGLGAPGTDTTKQFAGVVGAAQRMASVSERQSKQRAAFRKGQIEGLRKQKEAFEQGRRVIEQFLTPQERLIKRQKELKKWLGMGAIGWRTYNRAMAEARKALPGIKAQERAGIEGRRVTERFLSPQQKLIERQKKLRELYLGRKISRETYSRAIHEARQEKKRAGREAQIPLQPRLPGRPRTWQEVRAARLGPEAVTEPGQRGSLGLQKSGADIATIVARLDTMIEFAKAEADKPGLEDLEPAELE